MPSDQRDSRNSPRFAQPATFMRLPHQTDLTGVDVALLGVQFDAHIDTWGDYFGGKYFHGSPFRRAIEEGLIVPSRYVQIGIRGPMYGDDEDFAFQRAHGVTTIDIGQVKTDGTTSTMARVR